MDPDLCCGYLDCQHVPDSALGRVSTNSIGLHEGVGVVCMHSSADSKSGAKHAGVTS